MSPPWTGCHGVRVDPPTLGATFGWNHGPPLAETELVLGPAGSADGAELWRIVQAVAVPLGGVHHVDERLLRRGDGSFVFVASGAAVLAVDPARARITVAVEDEGAADQLVTTIGLPLLLHDTRALVVHASAGFSDEGATVVCGASGAGKSSLLVGLLAAEWDAVTEDFGAIDPDADPPVIWPGPPWLRRRHAEAGPPGAAIRFETPDKYAWDIDRERVQEPVPVERLVFLEPPGGAAAEWARLTPPEALKQLAPHALWLGDPDERGAASFGRCAQLIRSTPAFRLRLPVGDSWIDDAVEILSAI